MNVVIITADATVAREDADNSGGAVRGRLAEYAKHLSKLTVIVYSSRKPNLKSMRVGENVFIHPTLSRGPLPTLSAAFDAYRLVSRMLKTERIDVISTADPFFCGLAGYLLKRRYGIPLAVEIHGAYLDNKLWLKESKLNPLLNILAKFMVKRADAVRDVTEGIVRDYLIDRLSLNPNKIVTLPVFVPTVELGEYQACRALRAKYPDFENIVLFVGRLTKQKNIPNLFRAIPQVIARHQKTLFLIVGEGEERTGLEKMAHELGIDQNVAFEGFVDQSTLLECFYSSDIFVLPSNHEARPKVMIEAPACGLPIISTDVAGAREVISDGETGYIVPVNDPQALAQKIIYLLDNPELRREMGKRGQAWARETQDVQRNAYKYREFFEKAIENAKQ